MLNQRTTQVRAARTLKRPPPAAWHWWHGLLLIVLIMAAAGLWFLPAEYAALGAAEFIPRNWALWLRGGTALGLAFVAVVVRGQTWQHACIATLGAVALSFMLARHLQSADGLALPLGQLLTVLTLTLLLLLYLFRPSTSERLEDALEREREKDARIKHLEGELWGLQHRGQK